MKVFCAGFNLYGKFINIRDSTIETFRSIYYSNVTDIQISLAYLIIKINKNTHNKVRKNQRSKIYLHGFVNNKTHQIHKLVFDKDIAQISVSDHEALFLSTDGTIYQLSSYKPAGYSLKCLPNLLNTEQVVEETSKDSVSKIDSGLVISCAYSKQGYVYRIPTKTSSKISNIKDICCGTEHCLLITENGLVYSFGGGSRGQLGHGDVEDVIEPKLIKHLCGIKIIKIACGGWHSIALSADGDMYVWGSNSNGQLGLQTNKSETVDKGVSIMATPVVLELDTNVMDVACGSRHTIALLENSKLYGCGWNKYCQLGIKTTDENIYELKFLYDFANVNIIGLRCGTWNSAVLVDD